MDPDNSIASTNESPLPPAVIRGLGDRSYDKRKAAALEITQVSDKIKNMTLLLLLVVVVDFAVVVILNEKLLILFHRLCVAYKKSGRRRTLGMSSHCFHKNMSGQGMQTIEREV